MSNKSKFKSTSATILIITSTVLGSNDSKALANPFSNLWQRLKTAGSSLTLVNPFKTSSSGSNKLNKPNSKATLSNNSKTSNSLYSRLKSLFTKNSKQSYNITTENDKNANTTVHTLKGDDNKPTSKSKQKRDRLAAAYDNDTESLTPGEYSSSNDSNNISSIKQPEFKNKPKSNNPSVSFEELTISSIDDSSSNSKTNANSNKNSDLVLDLLSELEVRNILMDEELNHKSLLEKSINDSTDVNVKQGLYSHLGILNTKISDLEGEIKTIERLIQSLQN